MNRLLILYTKDNTSTGVDAQGRTYRYDKPARQLIAERCIANACTIKGRQDAAIVLFGWKRKLPVLISETSREIWFPLAGSMARENIWLAYDTVFSFHRLSDYETRIVFVNGGEAVVPYNVRTVRMQMRRCEEMTAWLNREKEDDAVPDMRGILPEI